MSTPTLINLPPPQSDTPSDMGPGTPNSGTTSLSALSTTAIKDGHQGHHQHGHMHTHSSASSSSTNTLDAERADRISRLAGLERVATLRSAHLAPGAAFSPAQQSAGYFDNSAIPQAREKSTVGSASATGSAAGRTRTWASGSDIADKMSEDPDDGVSSSGGLSDEGNASLVGFGEAASSTISGPTSGRMATGARGNVGGHFVTPRQDRPESGSPMEGIQETNPTMLDGLAHAGENVETPSYMGDNHLQTARAREHADAILQERLEEGERSKRALGSPEDEKVLGRFHFEER